MTYFYENCPEVQFDIKKEKLIKLNELALELWGTGKYENKKQARQEAKERIDREEQRKIAVKNDWELRQPKNL